MTAVKCPSRFVLMPRYPTEKILHAFWSGYNRNNGVQPDFNAYENMIRTAQDVCELAHPSQCALFDALAKTSGALDIVTSHYGLNQESSQVSFTEPHAHYGTMSVQQILNESRTVLAAHLEHLNREDAQ
ncbi:hypothetical protein [Roseibium sp. RKSG952]|uniref:hypothetical protein n=1 Tax=Roseibium sp. RKSG952 TaxID=2529384 RepID=UPI0012BB9EA8|nr:hypothetical protein [Roseibium sp. RKSG952]MTH95105.1 hypothetical protein [Roseibium sp. RKSG952]